MFDTYIDAFLQTLQKTNTIYATWMCASLNNKTLHRNDYNMLYLSHICRVWICTCLDDSVSPHPCPCLDVWVHLSWCTSYGPGCQRMLRSTYMIDRSTHTISCLIDAQCVGKCTRNKMCGGLQYMLIIIVTANIILTVADTGVLFNHLNRAKSAKCMAVSLLVIFIHVHNRKEIWCILHYIWWSCY